MYGIRVNPLAIKPGDSIATKFEFSHVLGSTNVFIIKKTRQVKRVDFCSSSPESVHLDHECYDTRFATVIRPN